MIMLKSKQISAPFAVLWSHDAVATILNLSHRYHIMSKSQDITCMIIVLLRTYRVIVNLRLVFGDLIEILDVF
jgi:hypothetical protein